MWLCCSHSSDLSAEEQVQRQSHPIYSTEDEEIRTVCETFRKSSKPRVTVPRADEVRQALEECDKIVGKHSVKAAFGILRADIAQEAASEGGERPPWLCGWDVRRQMLMEKLLEPFPPPGWQCFECSANVDGFQGTISAHYEATSHTLEMRSDLIFPGTVMDHLEGMLEPALGAEICPDCYLSGRQWDCSDIPGSVLFNLTVKVPVLPKRWQRDIVVHRQVFRQDQGFTCVDYSPKCLPGSCSKDCGGCSAYFQGGDWPNGLPGMSLPPCQVSGRESQIAVFHVEPCESGVRWSSVQVLEMFLPRWLPFYRWYAFGAAEILRRTLRDFHRAQREPGVKELYAKKVKEKPYNYDPLWYSPPSETLSV